MALTTTPLQVTVKEKIPPLFAYRPLIPAPNMQLTLRIGFTLIGTAYFMFHVQSPLLMNRANIITIALIFCVAYLALHAHILKHGRDVSRYAAFPFWLDTAGSFFVWLIDPLSPSPMMIFILIAAHANGVHNGFRAFRGIFWVTAAMAPVVYAGRSIMHGFHISELIFLMLGIFLMLYLYLVIIEINTLQKKAGKKTADLVEANNRLQKTGKALQESETRYRAIFEDSSTATVLAEEHTMLITLVNSKFEELTGYDRNELCNVKRLSDLIPVEDLDRVLRFYHVRRKKMSRKSTPAQIECRLADKNFNIKYVVIRFGVNTWHERVIITMVDITATRQSKIALQNYNARLLEVARKLQESQFRYRNLFENTGTATILVERNLRISMANSKFEELTGYLKQEILSTKRLTDFIERRSLSRIRRYHARIKKQNLPLPSEYECLIRGSSKSIMHVIMKVYTPPGQENSIVSFFDITARKKAEEQLQAVHEKMKAMAISDGLTGLANHRHFNNCLSHEWDRGLREATPLSLILCDVDYFKAYNDTYGHQAGDQCLRDIAREIKKHSRRALDLAARYGGEEFAVIMPHTDIKGALIVAEKIRACTENLKIVHEASAVAPFVTLSIGVATVMQYSGMNPDQLIKNADQALYKAKNKGRNRTEVLQQGIRGDVRFLKSVPKPGSIA
jgi:diguanylate cyclase (GGDEF)-like protein/PAS domain S-box-containing protein